MDINSLRMRLRHLSPVISNGPDGSLRVMEKSARVVCDVLAGLSDEEAVAAELAGILLKSASPHQEPPIWLHLNVVFEALALEDTCRALAVLAEFLKPHVSVQVNLYLAAPPAEWSSILSVVKYLRETLSEPDRVAIQVIGPLSVITDDEMGVLGNFGVRIAFSTGLTKVSCDYGLSDVDIATLRTFSGFGLRTPISWYVHADNIATIEERLPDLLISNYYSGFSLPLASCSPYYQAGVGSVSLPDATEYCQLLVRSYGQYPYYDDVMSPLSELALLVRNGGQNSELNLPCIIQMLIGSDGQVGLYRQTPALATRWTDIAEVASCQSESLRERFLEFAGGTSSLQTNPYCFECCWSHLCGGLDVQVPPPKSTREMDSMCWHRKLFLEHFASLRTPDVVLPAPQRSQ